MSILLHGALFLAGEALSRFSPDEELAPHGSLKGPFQVYGLETESPSVPSPSAARASAVEASSAVTAASAALAASPAETLQDSPSELPDDEAWEKGITFDSFPPPTGLGASGGGAVEDSDASFLVPSLIQWLDPEYPDTARRRGWEGEVELKFWVNEAGYIEDVQVLSSSRKVFEAAALEAARSARFAKAVGILAPSFPELRAFQLRVLFRLKD